MEMVLAIAGSRYYGDYSTFSKVVQDELERFPATRIVTGDSSGADTMAYDYAVSHGIPVTVYCANERNYRRLIGDGVDAVLVSNWSKEGRAAGPIRNAAMIGRAQKVLLFDGGGPGSRDVRKQAERKGIEVEVWVVTTALMTDLTGR